VILELTRLRRPVTLHHHVPGDTRHNAVTAFFR